LGCKGSSEGTPIPGTVALFPVKGFSVDTFWRVEGFSSFCLSLYAEFQRTSDVGFHEADDFLFRLVSVPSTVGCGIDDDVDAVLS